MALAGHDFNCYVFLILNRLNIEHIQSLLSENDRPRSRGGRVCRWVWDKWELPRDGSGEAASEAARTRRVRGGREQSQRGKLSSCRAGDRDRARLLKVKKKKAFPVGEKTSPPPPPPKSTNPRSNFFHGECSVRVVGTGTCCRVLFLGRGAGNGGVTLGFAEQERCRWGR